MAREAWQITESSPDSHERCQVPSVLAPLARMFLQRVALRPGQHVLDIACGTGVVARQAAPVVGPSGLLVGIDLNSKMLDVASRHAPADGAPVEWKRGDATALPCPDASFDVVLCQQGLQFFLDKAGALREMHGALKPGGLVGICVWCAIEHSPCHLAIAEALRRHVGPDAAKRLQAPFAYSDPDILREAMVAAGFLEPDIQVSILTRHLLSPEESVPGLIASTPAGPEIAAIPDATRDAIVGDVAAALSDCRDKDGLTVPQPTHIALART